MNADNEACTLTADSQYVELAVEVFAMLADATRVRLILALRHGELPVNVLAEKAGKSAAAVSQHLAKMRLARMVATRQEGTKVYYRLQDGHAWQLVADAIHQAEHTLGTAPHHSTAPHSPTREASA
jgi:DNA-binding transcriptional ArsR family regulator